MTDLEKLKALLDEFGVPFNVADSIDKERPGNQVVIGNPLGTGYDGLTYFDSDKVGGYSGFWAEFCFDPEGKFQFVGIWE